VSYLQTVDVDNMWWGRSSIMMMALSNRNPSFWIIKLM
jgi:hypothetical protein